MESRFDLIKGKKLLVIGLGKTGLSVIRKMLDFSSYIIGIDNNPDLDLGKAFRENTKQNNLEIILGDDKEQQQDLQIQYRSS